MGMILKYGLLFSASRYIVARMDNDRRLAPREPSSGSIRIKVESGGKTTTHDAQIIDVSIRGARIIASVKLQLGDFVEFLPPDDPDNPTRYVVAWTGLKSSDLEGVAGLRLLTPSHPK